MGGHIVQGHVDATAPMNRLESSGGFWILGIRVGEAWSRYVVEKGSIALDGISLTVSAVDAEELRVAVIPETFPLHDPLRHQREPHERRGRRPGEVRGAAPRSRRGPHRDDRLRALLGS